jgi:hypothetical protein
VTHYFHGLRKIIFNNHTIVDLFTELAQFTLYG